MDTYELVTSLTLGIVTAVSLTALFHLKATAIERKERPSVGTVSPNLRTGGSVAGKIFRR